MVKIAFATGRPLPHLDFIVRSGCLLKGGPPNGWPDEFSLFLDYTCTLPFESKPNYAYLCKLFHDLHIHKECQHDNVFGWHQPRMNQDYCSSQTPGVDVGANRTKENEKVGASYSN